MKCVPAESAKRYLREAGIADGVIKLRPEDYGAIPTGRRFMHVNAMPCTHRALARYAIVPIVGHGSGNEPFLDLTRPTIVMCEESSVLSSLMDMDEEDIPHVIGRPRSHDDLAEMMIARYGRTRGWTASNAKSEPVMLSILSVISRS